VRYRYAHEIRACYPARRCVFRNNYLTGYGNIMQSGRAAAVTPYHVYDGISLL
jgi:hypothetical protein